MEIIEFLFATYPFELIFILPIFGAFLAAWIAHRHHEQGGIDREHE